MAELPSGTVTFLFTDIEGSTARWEQQPEAMRLAVGRHDAVLRAAIVEHGGYVVKTMGDAFHAVFREAPDAVTVAIAAQRRLVTEAWDDVGGLRVRMALHTGVAEVRDGDYYGAVMNRTARLVSIGHGGQILLSEATAALVREGLPGDASLLDLGQHRLKDLTLPEHVFQVVAPDLEARFPDLASLDARPNNLPTHPTALLGRERELAEIRTLFEGGARLVTLTGPGGTGKTRLSLQVAADLLDRFEHGAFLVDLAPISDPALVPSTIAQVLGVRDLGTRPIVETLKEYLRSRSVLLLLDNFEQILPAASDVAELLTMCPGLTVLTTSREPLRLRGEHEYAVPPLALPDAGQAATPDAVRYSPAVVLFVQRAREIRADFALTDEKVVAVAQICARVDGLPLAIELAAARVRLMTPEAMARRLERRLPLLVGGARDLPARQQALRDTIAWSYELLNEQERRLFPQLAVFVGGWTLDAAEGVCNADGASDVWGGLESLVSKSLIKQDADTRGELRFGMLETIREYALERLERSEEADVIRRRHVEYFATFVEEADANLRGPDQGTHLARIDVDYDNLRTAIAWACGRREAELAMRLTGGLSWFWFVRSHFGEGQGWLDRALSLPGANVATLARAQALWGAGVMARNQGDYERARTCHEEGLAIRRGLGDVEGAAWVVGALALVHQSVSNRQQAGSLFEEGLEAFRRTRNVWRTAWFLYNLGGHLVEGEERDLRRAAVLLEEGLALYRQSRDQWAIGSTLIALGRAAERLGDVERACQLVDESLAVSRDVGNRLGAAGALRQIAHLAQLHGETGRATSAAKEALSIAFEIWNRAGVIRSIQLLGSVLADQCEDRKAICLLAASAALRDVIGYAWGAGEREEVDRSLKLARSRLDESSFARAWAEGRAMTLEQAVAYALEEVGSPGTELEFAL